ncbi:uncharacterized protein LOC110974691 [Acanthaster planci]|uniref:Uncharacterized protein LOC110974691 n=1 Tax=Acanthaster planci TaxID=133434 RepID=A0A8B7XQ55_ACAPL|nr:uncharacterized protein LOC110974691 [Acanthaster planci]
MKLQEVAMNFCGAVMPLLVMLLSGLSFSCDTGNSTTFGNQTIMSTMSRNFSPPNSRLQDHTSKGRPVYGNKELGIRDMEDNASALLNSNLHRKNTEGADVKSKPIINDFGPRAMKRRHLERSKREADPPAFTESNPELEPAAEPESEPTAEPESEPTPEAESEPTADPESEPRAEPDSEPTAEPESEPTTEPGSELTSEPESEPTAEPGSEPTAEPESEPTPEPESEPTAEPESEPTAEPESEPTAEPESEPTAEPESEPTAEPESEPTAEPESEPTAEPESEPTAEPESEPTAEPESEPTAEPESEPTAEPESEPTAEPESEPTGEPEYRPEGEPQSQPTNEPESEPSGIPEPEAEPSAEPESESEPEPVGEDWPEPGPDWNTLPELIGVAFTCHVYIFAIYFSLLTLYGLQILIALIFEFKKGNRSVLSLTFNTLLFLLGMTRAVSLFANPYGSYQNLPMVLSRMMWSVGFPCLTAAMTTVLLVLLDTTRLSLGPPRFQKFSTVSICCAGHFIAVLGSDLLVSAFIDLKVILVICQFIYVAWSGSLAVGFFRVSYKMKKNFASTFAKKGMRGGKEQKASPLRLYRMVIYCGLAALASCATNLYGAVGVFGVYSDLEFVEAWPWWIFQTAMRAEEVAMSVLVVLLAGKAGKDGFGRFVGLLCRSTRPCLARIRRLRAGQVRPASRSVSPGRWAVSGSGSTEKMMLSEDRSMTVGVTIASDAVHDMDGSAKKFPYPDDNLPVVAEL